MEVAIVVLSIAGISVLLAFRSMYGLGLEEKTKKRKKSKKSSKKSKKKKGSIV